MKRIVPMIDARGLDDDKAVYFPDTEAEPGPFALHTEDGQILPGQVSTSMNSEPGVPVKLTVTFTVDGDKITVQGDK
ncbi:hypothetical protein [Pseudomonas helleri]|uniref:hypothetical protein n=1 Tax=Pseudomonas helleri TaxID=1608996 RepID=UPI003F988FB6